MPTRKKVQAETDLGENKPTRATVKKVAIKPTVEKKYGIKELSDVVILVCTFVYALSRSEHKGRNFWRDALKYVGTIKHVPEAIRGFRDVPNEIKDLDQEELKALHKLIETNFQLADKNKEKTIESMLTATFEVVRAVHSLFG